MIRVFGWQTSAAAEHDFRIGLPFPQLSSKRFVADVGVPGQPGVPPDDLATYDVVFAHRLAGRSDLWHRLCADPDVLCVYDMDDDLLSVDPANTIPYRIFAPLAEETYRNVEAADVVTVSSPALAERYARINPRVAVLPQVIPDGMCDWPRQAEDRPLTVGWAGSMHKRQDWPGIARALAEFGRLVPAARFRMYGADYTGGLLGDRVDRVPFTDPATYWRTLAFDIGIAPLVDTPFNQGKTTTKLLEYGAAGIPTVAAAVGQYMDWVEPGVNGYLVDDPSEWVPYLLALVDDEHRHAAGAAARDKARESEVSRQIHHWEAVFEGRLP